MHQAQLDLLVFEAQSGNEKAFECLVIFFHPQLINFACNLSGNHALAKDAVQDVWITMSKKLSKLEDPRALKSWLFRALRWRILDLVKAKSYQFQAIEDTYLSVELDESEIERQQLRKAINKLPDRERSVIYLFYLVELPLAEVALVLEIPQGTVKSRLNKARVSLHQQLDFNVTT
ncbi:sigma-70 family RNA polymerase sigma factor [Paraglaciecola sp.]|uniref:RNA polymerase sigma factor n=1 Tax=Paraglaciecola sp. TaxID=1920173 RepID=UPI0030F38AED